MPKQKNTALWKSSQITTTDDQQHKEQKYYVIFTDFGSVWWLKWLKPGFRHCFVAVEEGGNWSYIESVLSGIEVRCTTNNVLGGLAADGCHIIEAPRFDMNYTRLAPIEPVTCVTVVKRVLRLNRWFILTPHQLYKFLKKSVDNVS